MSMDGRENCTIASVDKARLVLDDGDRQREGRGEHALELPVLRPRTAVQGHDDGHRRVRRERRQQLAQRVEAAPRTADDDELGAHRFLR
jgi:hypothetical protein